MSHTIALALHFLRDMAHRYGADPMIFAALYIGGIPPYWASFFWLLHSARKRRPLLWPGLLTLFLFPLPYYYVAAVGHGVPAWVYGCIGFCLVTGLVSIALQLRGALRQKSPPIEPAKRRKNGDGRR